MRKFLLNMAVIFTVVFSLNACSIAPAEKNAIPSTELRDTHEKLHSVLWMQTSAEYQILANIAYSQAKLSVDAALKDSNWTAALEQKDSYSLLSPAVIVDIDETVLDNSKYQGRLVTNRSEYKESVWREWTEKHAATIVPGAYDFLNYVKSKQVTVFYITNRDVSQEADTRKNIADLNLPLRTDIDVILSKNENNWTSSDKGERRAYVSKNFRILVLIGDDLGDFLSGAKDTPDNRVKLAKTHSDMWGSKWVLLPNPIYGSWEAALYGHDFKIPDKNVLEIKFKSVIDF